MIDNDIFLNQIDGGSLWDCDKKLKEGRNLITRTGKVGSLRCFQVGIVLWLISVWSIGCLDRK